jgi:hypothetical protein
MRFSDFKNSVYYVFYALSGAEFENGVIKSPDFAVKGRSKRPTTTAFFLK